MAWAGRSRGGADGGLSVPVAVGDRPETLRFRAWSEARVGGARLSESGDAALVALLLPAMTVGEALAVDAPVSPRLLAGAERLQDVFRTWQPRRFRRVPVAARAEPAAPPAGRGVAVFFSGGVDSFYSALRHRDRLDALLFVHGWDVPVEAGALRTSISARLREAARALGRPLLEVETNLYPFATPYVKWRWYHGAAMASVALALSAEMAEVLIPSSNPYTKLHPWGSHVLTDPLWSTEATALVHDGCEATRLEKVAVVATSPVALRALRVCFENRGGAYNCGACEKCLRTMVALRVVGALDRCSAFARPLDLDAVAALDLPPAQTYSEYTDVLAAAEAAGHDPALARALRACLTPGVTAGAAP